MNKYQRAIKGDVYWYAPNKKRPIAYSTKATKDLIEILAEDNPTFLTLFFRINYDKEAKNIIKKYIDMGYGNCKY